MTLILATELIVYLYNENLLKSTNITLEQNFQVMKKLNLIH